MINKLVRGWDKTTCLLAYINSYTLIHSYSIPTSLSPYMDSTVVSIALHYITLPSLAYITLIHAYTYYLP